ncbi:S-layer homology domain-containing protein [Pseudoflavonifractor phocaeensis]|uniref:S-layer homology domain-containing protein n=1 Tax=Pseudoflavonifractor phocaeensis TaxID=1870988 RepID=UPI00195D60B5|nr:S-layer homology domain-containing protein [Pseudoflavonifractor phocaeensis]MBM6869763.1 S-layer homology domain-containing protein [Pseudoflavonifractor phocaeensis]MBM6939016.1 S-layer homology domain-containing protein [Pseudoflavonifractor phocaeensis]
MKGKRWMAGLLAAALLVGGGTALAAGGDVLVPLSYLTGELLPSLLGQAEDRIASDTQKTYEEALADLQEEYQSDMASAGGQTGLKDRRYKRGDVISLTVGSGAMALAGDVEIAGGTAVNVTGGYTLPLGAALPLRHKLLASESGTLSLRVVSETAVISLEGVYSLEASTATDYNALAGALAEMGLFRGTDTAYGSGYDLENIPTRIEGLVMFLRLIGEEEAALSYTGVNPFVDVPAWADRYVAYAYSKGYTTGVSGTAFAPERAMGASEYVIFLLRALGYSETGDNPDFTWQTALAQGKALGVLTSGEYTLLTAEETTFCRAHLAYLSYFVLDAQRKAGGTLLDWMDDKGAVDAAEIRSIQAGVAVTRQ